MNRTTLEAVILTRLGPESPRTALLGLLAVLAGVWWAPGAAGLQAPGPPRLPEPSSEVASAVEEILDDYYDGWRGVGGQPTPCDADRGDVCHDADPDGGCNRRRCRTRAEMLEFVDRLAAVAASHPDEPEPLAQAAYSAVTLGLEERAEDLVEACAPRRTWWCDLAAGYALDRRGRPEDAEPPLDRALAAMPATLRCSLQDVRALLPEDRRDEYDAMPCEDRREAHRWFWWVSDPFLVDGANDRWSEHLVRGFEAMMRQGGPGLLRRQ